MLLAALSTTLAACGSEGASSYAAPSGSDVFGPTGRSPGRPVVPPRPVTPMRPATPAAGAAIPSAPDVATTPAPVGSSDVPAALPSGGAPSQAAAPEAPATISEQEQEPAAPPPTEREAARFLMHATFGPTRREIARVVELGYAGWIDAQTARPGLGSRYAWLLERGHLARDQKDFFTGFDGVMWRSLMTSPDVLRQRVALALSEIFAVDVKGIVRVGHFKAAGGAAYADLLERHAFGNFRQLLEAVTLSHQMGAYLSLVGSRRADGAGREPDENFARELMQLFTIGLVELRPDGTARTGPDGSPVPTYGQDDVAGVARALTGWERNGVVWGEHGHWSSPMRARPERHESGEKRFLGTVIPAGTGPEESLGIVLDTVFAHPNVGPFIGRALIQRLVTSNPSPAYVERVAAAFDDDGNGVRGELGAVVRQVLLDPEARTEPLLDAFTFGKAREPIVRLVHWARAFRADSENGAWAIHDLSDPARRLGQAPLRAPSVFNFYRPDHVPPNTELADEGLVAPELQIADETSLVGYANFMELVVPGGLGGVVPDYADELALAHDATALVDHLDLVLAAGRLSQETRDVVVGALESLPGDVPDAPRAARLKRVHAAVFLVLVSPDSQVQS